VSDTNKHSSPRRGRHWRTAAAAAALLAGAGATTLTFALNSASTPPPLPTAAQSGTLTLTAPPDAAAAAQPLAMTSSKPVTVSIPSIGVDAAIDNLGLNADGTVQVPSHPMDAGWYNGSAAPGQLGAAVLLGHVDFKATGPAVFYQLGALKPGSAVTITREDGTTATFTVTAVREFPKNAFPTAEVYQASSDAAQLRLITCGSWDSNQSAYTGNTVAFATLTAVSRLPAPTPITNTRLQTRAVGH
jgi:hypothetical protein